MMGFFLNNLFIGYNDRGKSVSYDLYYFQTFTPETVFIFFPTYLTSKT